MPTTVTGRGSLRASHLLDSLQARSSLQDIGP